MAIRKIPPEDFVEFVIENGFKNLPELVDKYPIEIMRGRLNRNIQKVFESRDDSVIYNACYSKDDNSICIVNLEKRFNLDLLKQEDDKLHSAIHESIHALISKKYSRKKTKEGTYSKKIKDFLKLKTFYVGRFLRNIDTKKNLPIRTYGITKSDKKSAITRNIKGFFKGDKKFKYEGSLISKFFYMKNSLFYLSKQKAIGLEEGFTEWLTRKTIGYGSTYKNVVCIINQIEAVLGTRRTIDLADGKLPGIRKMLNMEYGPFYEMIYRMDEIVRAEYRKETFEKKLELLKKRKENPPKDETVIDKVKQKVDVISEDLRNYDSDEKSHVSVVRDYYKEIIHENLMKTENILIDNFLIENVYEALNKKELELKDLKKCVRIFEEIRIFALNSDISQSKFLKSKSYKRFEKVFQDLGKRFLVEYKDKLKNFSGEELEYAYEIYDYFERNDEESAFYDTLEECKNQNFYEKILPEMKEKFNPGEKMYFEDIEKFVNAKGVLLNDKEFWTYILNRDVTEDDVAKINLERSLYSNFGIKFNKENLLEDKYSDRYNLVVNGKFLGVVRKEYAELFFKDKNYFSDDKFECDSSLNIEGLLDYEEYLCFQKEKRKICDGNIDLEELIDNGDISLFEAEQIKNGTYIKPEKNQEEKPKTSFKRIIEKIFRKKSIDIADVKSVGLESENIER